MFDWAFWAKFYAKLDRSDEAIADLIKAISLQPSYAYGYFERGFTYCLQGSYGKTIKDFEVAVAHHPDWGRSTIVIEAYHNRGVERIQKKSYRKAMRISIEPSKSIRNI